MSIATIPSFATPQGLALSGAFAFGHIHAPVRVLVVDDENGPRQSLRMLLNREYDVTLANDVPSAMNIVRAGGIDIIITDIRMPHQSGLDLLRMVKHERPEIQVIILTGFGQLDSAMEAIEYGAFAYVEKPFDSEMMLAKVAACRERVRLEQDRRALEYLAMEANRFETLGRLVSGTMHDLGTPLSVIGANLELIIQNPNKEDIHKRLQTMNSQVQHCNDLVRTTMNFLRHPSEERAPFNLNQAAKVCLDVASPLLTGKRVRVEARLEEPLPDCEGDLVLVRQAVLNLIYNACQAMENQSEERVLTLETRRKDNHIHLAVQDTGPGVPEENKGRIFDTMFTTKGKNGTGLGLTVVRTVMQRHRGDVFLDEAPARGARFVLEFPIRAAHH